MRVCVFWILRILNSWGLEISGLLDLWALFFACSGFRDIEISGLLDFEIIGSLHFGDFGMLGFLGFSLDPPIPGVGLFNFHHYPGGRLIDPATRHRFLLRRLCPREASENSGDGSRRHHLLNR